MGVYLPSSTAKGEGEVGILMHWTGSESVSLGRVPFCIIFSCLVATFQ